MSNINKSNKNKMIHVRLSPEDHKALRLLVVEEDTTIQDWVSERIIKKLEEKEVRNI